MYAVLSVCLAKLLVCRDKIHIPVLGHTCWRGVTIIAWAAEHARGFYYNMDGKGDFFTLNGCACVDSYSGTTGFEAAY